MTTAHTHDRVFEPHELARPPAAEVQVRVARELVVRCRSLTRTAPRATAERAAQEVVAALIDSIPAAPQALTIRRRAAAPATRQQRVTV